MLVSMRQDTLHGFFNKELSSRYWQTKMRLHSIVIYKISCFAQICLCQPKYYYIRPVHGGMSVNGDWLVIAILLILINKSSPGQKRSLQQYILDEKSVQFTRKFFAILLLTKIFLSIKCRFDRTIQSIGCILKKYHKKRNRGRVFTLPVFHYAQTPF